VTGRTRGLLILVVLAVLMGLLSGVAALAGFKTVSPGATAPPLPDGGFPYDDLAEVLDRWVSPEGVDYVGLAAHAEPLRRFVAQTAVTGPRTDPARFPTEEDRLAYYINAYNALVLLAVVEHWPITTVHEVRGRIEPKAGFGFFYGLRFVLDGRKTNLYDLDNKVIRPFGDARIHAAINCASRSCPTLASAPFQGATLDRQLAEAARGFSGATRHVDVDDQARVVRLSSIFEWFATDFGDVLGWLEGVADPDTAAAIERARAGGYGLEHVAYDWSLNDQP